MSPSSTAFTVPFRDLGLRDIPLVGGKNASLGELIRSLVPLGVRVPDGFAVTAEAFQAHLARGQLRDQIYPALERLDVRDVQALAREGQRIRDLIRAAPLPDGLSDEIERAYRRLSEGYGESETDVAVRSSATAEDLPDASFAGQQETFLNIGGIDNILHAVKLVFSSLSNDRALS